MKKDEVQSKIGNQIIEAGFRGIVLASVRTGKTRIILNSILKHTGDKYPRILVLYPNIDVKTSWTDECEKLDYPFSLHFCTFRSMEKVKDEEWDYVIFDEAHLIPEETKLPIAGEMVRKNKHCILASGTYNPTTLADIKIHTTLPMIVEYSTEDAIRDGLVLDFDVFIHYYNLNKIIQRKIRVGKGSWWSTDRRECDRLTNRMFKASGEQQRALAALTRMRFINSNESLVSAIRMWIKDNPNERFIMFTDNEAFGNRFNLPMFNSKSKDDVVLKQFQSGEIDQLCLIKKGSAGVTYPNLKSILITSINSNGETLEQMLGRALLTDTEKANLHVFVSEEDFQSKWLISALENIQAHKIFGLKEAKSL